jgi:hypothetical protein
MIRLLRDVWPASCFTFLKTTLGRLISFAEQGSDKTISNSRTHLFEFTPGVLFPLARPIFKLRLGLGSRSGERQASPRTREQPPVVSPCTVLLSGPDIRLVDFRDKPTLLDNIRPLARYRCNTSHLLPHMRAMIGRYLDYKRSLPNHQQDTHSNERDDHEWWLRWPRP